MKTQTTEDRKDSHLKICLNESVEYSSEDMTGFSHFRFDHDALPEINKSEIDLTVKVFGKLLKAPLIIGAMTGGTDQAGVINQRLAKAAAKCGIGFALGSQRKMLENPTVRSSYAVKDFASDLPLLIGNIGVVQLNYGVSIQAINSLIREVSCDAFSFHLNPLQESIQPEGDINFSGLMSKLGQIIPDLGVPVLVKEVGAGISETTAMKLKTLKLAGVETSGLGGTSWSKIESLRTHDPIQQKTGELFARWGIPTAESVVCCRKHLPGLVLIASGGMRNGIEAAKAIALGADLVAFALPMLKAAEHSVDAVIDVIHEITQALKTVMFLTGCKNILELQKTTLKQLPDFTARSLK